MVPTWPETRVDDTEFDLDVRLEAASRHPSDEAALKPTDQGCPDGPTNITCHAGGGCLQ